MKIWNARLSLVLIFFLTAVTVPVNSFADDPSETAGDILQIALPAMAYGMTFAYQDDEGRQQFYPSFFSTLGITYALKYSIESQRPNGGNRSFPSGHTSAAFSGASFIQRRYGWVYGAPAYLAASFVGWSRIESEDHYVEDVLAGAGIGILCTYLFTKPYLDKMTVLPFVSDKKFGVTLVVAW